MAEITLAQLTEKKIDGSGVFDTLMATARLYLDEQYSNDRIRGPEYATVYLGQLENVLNTALQFLMQREKAGLEADLVRLQITLAEVQVRQAEAQLLQIEAQTELLKEQKANAVLEGKVLVAQECKLKAEYDLTMKNVEKAGAETTLLAQRTATEKAQILGLGVDEDSVIGRQKALYVAQTQGFRSDRIQKAANIYTDVWKACRMTDDGWQANAVQGLDDMSIGSVMRALRTDIGIVPA